MYVSEVAVIASSHKKLKKKTKKQKSLDFKRGRKKSFNKKKKLFREKASYLLNEKGWRSDVVLEMHNLNIFHEIKIYVSKFPTL